MVYRSLGDLGASLSNDPPCDILGCKYLAEYAIYPDRFRRIELAHYLCVDHHVKAKDLRQWREELYQVANRLIRESLAQN